MGHVPRVEVRDGALFAYWCTRGRSLERCTRAPTHSRHGPETLDVAGSVGRALGVRRLHGHERGWSGAKRPIRAVWSLTRWYSHCRATLHSLAAAWIPSRPIPALERTYGSTTCGGANIPISPHPRHSGPSKPPGAEASSRWPLVIYVGNATAARPEQSSQRCAHPDAHLARSERGAPAWSCGRPDGRRGGSSTSCRACPRRVVDSRIGDGGSLPVPPTSLRRYSRNKLFQSCRRDSRCGQRLPAGPRGLEETGRDHGWTSAT